MPSRFIRSASRSSLVLLCLGATAAGGEDGAFAFVISRAREGATTLLKRAMWPATGVSQGELHCLACGGGGRKAAIPRVILESQDLD
mmetsp:Transcript_15723/g.36218  ORF Transcript_15723/g.36218 Transcript_15723/m.36218 type:complete len:87 (-) Transcript_15723:11-271(-)